MDRREAIKTTSLLMGFSLTGAALSGTLSGCRPNTSNNWKPQSLSVAQSEFVAGLAETIIPATDTPGAKDVFVHRFIDQLITDFFTENERATFLSRLDGLSDKCIAATGKSYVECNPEDRHSFLMAEEEKGGKLPFTLWGNKLSEGENPTFYRELKSMILWGYFSSELVGKEVLNYQQIPGKYLGCIDIGPETRSWSL